MSNWVFGTAGIGIIVLTLAIYLFGKDTPIMIQQQKKSTYLVPNLTLAIISIAWLGLAMYLYLDIQNQINYFLNR